MKHGLIIFLLLLVSCQNSGKDKDIHSSSAKEISETSIENLDKPKESKNKLDSEQKKEYKFDDLTFTSENYSASIIVGSLSATNWDDDDCKNLKNWIKSCLPHF